MKHRTAHGCLVVLLITGFSVGTALLTQGITKQSIADKMAAGKLTLETHTFGNGEKIARLIEPTVNPSVPLPTSSVSEPQIIASK